MTREEAIKTIETAIAEVEWEYPMDYAVAFEMAITALREQESNCPEIEAIKGVEIDQVKTGWIPVTERLPENDNEVLTASGQTVQILFYDHDDADWYTVDSDISVHLFCDNVTHWMPLPEPPKEV